MIKAFGNRLIVQLVAIEKKQGTIIITSSNEQMIGLVKSVGAELADEIKEGNFVYLRGHGGLPVKHKGVEYLCVYPNEILAVCEELEWHGNQGEAKRPSSALDL